MNLADEACVPCRGTVAPLPAGEAAALLATRTGWEMRGGAIARRWKFKNFMTAQDFVNRVGLLAEGAGHHPDIAYGWGYAVVTLTTHAAHGLTRNDFVMAAKIDALS